MGKKFGLDLHGTAAKILRYNDEAICLMIWLKSNEYAFKEILEEICSGLQFLAHHNEQLMFVTG